MCSRRQRNGSNDYQWQTSRSFNHSKSSKTFYLQFFKEVVPWIWKFSERNKMKEIMFYIHLINRVFRLWIVKTNFEFSIFRLFKSSCLKWPVSCHFFEIGLWLGRQDIFLWNWILLKDFNQWNWEFLQLDSYFYQIKAENKLSDSKRRCTVNELFIPVLYIISVSRNGDT